MPEPAPISGPVVIIGAGQAGMQLAMSLRQQGTEVPITLLGDEPHPPYERPPLSKAFLKGDLEEERLYFRKPQAYADQRIDLRLGVRVRAIDRAAKVVRLEDGTALPYAACVIATGSRARRLDLPGADLDGVVTLRGIDDAHTLRARVRQGLETAVIGGGYIGMEIAASLTGLGAHVTVIEALPRVLSRGIAPVVAAHLTARHEAEGVTLETGIGVTAFEGQGRVEAIRLADGRLIKAALVVVGVGAALNDELAAAAGLATDGGVVTDACARTSDPAIFAIGDVAVQDHAFLGRRIRLESVQNATDQAKAVARTLTSGTPVPMTEVPWFWTQQFDLMVQMAGVADDGLDWIVRGRPEADAFAVYGLTGDVVTAVQAVNSGADYALGRRLIRERLRIAPERLADPATDVKTLVSRKRG